ncbi:unnamed protein product [Prorocentrum cordatum]|uniref:Calmodulin n=1 Tax=Prorocentrum cordatum TaxID=2364126 RepID=A0ABN9QEV8_9DINO|nr:unnamed protein product [Polarella glacialis]
MLAPGARVRLRELRAKPHLNGREGSVKGQSGEAQRWTVRLDDGTEFALKPANLEILAAAAATGPTAAAASAPAVAEEVLHGLDCVVADAELSRRSVCDAMVYCMEHAGSHAENLARRLVGALGQEGLGTEGVLARLFVISDVLYNSIQSKRSRSADACENLGRTWLQPIASREERARGEGGVRRVFGAWEAWRVFLPLFTKGLECLLLAPEMRDVSCREAAGEPDERLRPKLTRWYGGLEQAALPQACLERGLKGPHALPPVLCRARLCHFERFWHLQVGRAVRLHSLVAAPHLNGEVAACEQWDSGAGRWKVRLKTGEIKAVRCENLMLRLLWQGSPSVSPLQSEIGLRQAGSMAMVPQGLPDLLKTARPWDKLHCLYSLEERLYHERLLCAHVDGSRWVVATPDGDVYVEDFADDDHVEIHRAGPRGGAPPQLRKKMLYRFDMDEQGLIALMDEGVRLSESERHEVRHDPVARSGAGGGPFPPVQLDDSWVALESRLGFRRGSPVDVTFATVYAMDDRALASFPEGVITLGRVGTLSDEVPISPRDAQEDVLDERILRYRRSGSGQRRRAFAEVVAEQREALTTEEWRAQGPATIGRLLQAHLGQGSGPVQRHYWWRQILGLAAADPGVDEHLFLCELIETASTADQLNLPGCEAFELAARRFQLWEEVYSEALRQVEVAGTAGATADSDGWLDERRIFLGGTRSKGHALVSPPLEKHAAERMQEESAILKEVWLREGIAALNDLGGRGADIPVGAPTACQVAAVRRLAQLYGRVEPPPSDVTPLGAWQTLQASRNGYADVMAEGASTTYRKGAMALPRAAAGRVRLVDVLPPHLQSLLSDSSQMLQEPEARNFALGEAPRVCAMDPVLQRHGYQLGECLSELLSAGIIERASEGSIIERAGIFFVPKKDSSLRLIFDTRRSNAHFQDPPYTLLASGEALANLEVDAAEGVAVASGDVECCFYQYELPSWARAFFGLPAVQARFLDPAARQQLGVSDPSEMIHFVARVVPMGWSWAVHLIQEAHAHVLSTVSPEAPWIADKAAATPPWRVERMLAALSARGIQASFDRDDGDLHTLLGFVLHKPSATWRLSQSKFWRLKFSFDVVLTPGRLVTGRELERLMGHITAAVMLQRHMLSLFHAIYEFCRRSRDKRQPLWSSVRRELSWFRALLPCVTVSLSLRRVGSLSERSRFRGVLTADYAPRDTLVEQQLLHASAADVTAEGTLTHFEEVPAARLLADPWAVAAARRWRRAAAIHVLEAEGARWAVRRLARNSQLHGHRHLILGDNLGAVCACEKGRAAHFALNVVCREICAISIAAGMQLRFRWIPSELNPGDAPSRRFMPGMGKQHGVGQCGTPSARGEKGTQQAGPLSGAIGSREHNHASDGLLAYLRQGWTSPAPLSDRPAEVCARRARLCPRLSRLAARRVRHATVLSYLRALTVLLGWLRLLALPCWTPAQWGETLVDYPEWAFDRGMGREAFSRTLCAVAWGEPALGGPVRRLFPAGHASLSGWTRLQPGHSRPPLPRAIALAMAAVLVSMGKPDSGLCILVAFECYLRPSEAATLLAKQLLPGRCNEVGVLQYPLLILHPEELATSSKTGEFDSTVAFDLPRHHWIGRAAVRLQRLRRKGELLFQISYPQFLADFHAACHYLKLEGLGFSPHCLRHGGATHDRAAGCRSLPEVQRRGMWRAASSARRYDKAGRLALVTRNLSSAHRKGCEAWAAAAQRLFDNAYVLPSAPAASASAVGAPAALDALADGEHLDGEPLTDAELAAALAEAEEPSLSGLGGAASLLAYLDAAALDVAYAESGQRELSGSLGHPQECDVWVTRDEQLVLSHDFNFQAVAEDPSQDLATRPIAELRWEELRRLRLRTDCKPVLLLTVLQEFDLLPTSTRLAIELKSSSCAPRLAACLAERPELSAAVGFVLSFSLGVLEAFAATLGRVAADTRLVWIVDNPRVPYSEGGLDEGETTFDYSAESLPDFLERIGDGAHRTRADARLRPLPAVQPCRDGPGSLRAAGRAAQRVQLWHARPLERPLARPRHRLGRCAVLAAARARPGELRPAWSLLRQHGRTAANSGELKPGPPKCWSE